MSFVLAMSVGASWGRDSHEEIDNRFLKAFNANDLEAILACYADDAVLYPPDAFVARGKDAIRKNWQEFLGQFKVSQAKISDATYVDMNDKSAGWGIVEMTMTPLAGAEAMPMKVRFTSVAAKRDGKWLYIADHASLPMAPPPTSTPATTPTNR